MDNNIADYALMCVAAYRDKRDPTNQVFPATVWEALPGSLGHLPTDSSGFEAVAYRNAQTNEIVIAYTGTDELKDWWTNVGGVSALWATDQMKSAARFYAEVCRANPEANITLTGHSLGGGLAGLMAVLFNRSAYTFDPAPFRASANDDTLSLIREDLANHGLLDGEVGARITTALDGFFSELPSSQNPPSPGTGIRGENRVHRMLVQNEAVSRWAPDNFIGTLEPRILGHASLDQSSIDLHSMSLEAAMVAAPGFWDAAKKLANLLPVIFDDRLFKKNPTQPTPTLLDHLLRNQGGVLGPNTGDVTDSAKQKMLSHFAADLAKVVAAGGVAVTDDNLNRALLAFLGRAYLKQDRGFEKELFKGVGGGLNFDTGDVSSDISADPGYETYLKTYLEQKLGTDLFGQFQTLILQTRDWYLASTALTATASTQRAFMLGGASADSLTGGTQDDLLVGLGGADRLEGGSGSDTYVFGANAGRDTLIDSDGQGRIRVAGRTDALSGSTEACELDSLRRRLWRDADGIEYIQDGKDLIIGGGALGAGEIRLQDFDFRNGALGITLKPDNKVAIGTAGEANPFLEGGDGGAAHGPLDLAEGLSRSLRIFLNGRAQAGDTLTLALSGGEGADYAIVNGAEQIDFTGGPVQLELAAGQTEIAVAFLNTGDVDDDASLALTAAWQPADPDQSASEGYSLTLNLDAAEEPDWAGDAFDRTIVGDQAPLDFDPDEAGVQTRIDELGNLITDQPEPGRADTLYDSAGADRIEAGDGDDSLFAYRGGNDLLDGGGGDDEIEAGAGDDRVLGGAGRDVLRGQAGDDRMEGGEDADFLYGWEGDDKLLAEAELTLEAAIAQGESGAGSTDRGDFLQGNAGRDTVIGGGAKDLISGGEGEDILVGGAGDDLLSGDDQYSAFSYDWSVERTVETDPDGGTTYRYTVSGASGTQPAGAGDALHGGAEDNCAVVFFVPGKSQSARYGDKSQSPEDGAGAAANDC